MTATRLRDIAAMLRALDTSYDEVMLVLKDIAIGMEQ